MGIVGSRHNCNVIVNQRFIAIFVVLPNTLVLKVNKTEFGVKFIFQKSESRYDPGCSYVAKTAVNKYSVFYVLVSSSWILPSHHLYFIPIFPW